jgi:SprT protein
MKSIVNLDDFPKETLHWIYLKVREEKIFLKIVKPRKRRLGDYFYNAEDREHRISLNNNLGEDFFLLTFIHELAHKKTFDRHGRKVLPHGKEWKKCFKKLLEEGLKITSDAKTVNLLKTHFKKPMASVRIKDESYQGLTAADLKFNDKFQIKGSSITYIIKEKRRTRFNCISTANNKDYVISSEAPVTLCS